MADKAHNPQSNTDEQHDRFRHFLRPFQFQDRATLDRWAREAVAIAKSDAALESGMKKKESNYAQQCVMQGEAPHVLVDNNDLDAFLNFVKAWGVQAFTDADTGQEATDVSFPANVDEKFAKTILTRFDELNT